MSREVVVLNTFAERSKALRMVSEATDGTRIEFREGETRSDRQNALMWSRLTDIAEQVVWYGQKLDKTDWKDMLTASLRKARVVPGIDPGSFVVTGLHTSKMSSAEMSDLLEMAVAFGTERGVVFSDTPEERR